MGALRPASLRALDDSLAQPHAIEGVETAARRRPLHVGGRRPRFPSERNVLMELPESSSGLEGIQSRLDEQLAEAQRNMQRAEAFAAQAQDLTAFARSEGGEVSVEVDGGGVPLDVKVTAKPSLWRRRRFRSSSSTSFARRIAKPSKSTKIWRVRSSETRRRRSNSSPRPVSASRLTSVTKGKADSAIARLRFPEAGRVEAGTREADASDGHTESPAS